MLYIILGLFLFWYHDLFLINASVWIDFVFRVAGLTLYIGSKAQLSVLGTEMDYVQDKLSSGFVFNNPNIKGTCGCGESFHL